MRQKHGEEVREGSLQGAVTFWPTQLACYQSRFSHRPLTQAPWGERWCLVLGLLCVPVIHYTEGEKRTKCNPYN